ncbi:alpha/beta hydrolase family protein [Pirellulaceae bacterium SH449]
MKLIAIFAFLSTAAMNLSPTFANDGYLLPPKEIVDIIDAKPEPTLSLSPDSRWLVFLERDAMPEIEDLARRAVPLAGMRIDPANNSSFQTSFYRGLSIRLLEKPDAAPVTIPIDAPVKISSLSWSHTSDCLVYVVQRDANQELWWMSVEEPNCPILLTDRLSTVLFEFEWMPDGKSVLCATVPTARGEEPAKPRAPVGPTVQESFGNKSPARTFQNLLTNPHDEELFDYFGKVQLAVLTPNQPARWIGKPAILLDADASPDGSLFLTTALAKPYSYQLTVGSFPKTISVVDWSGDEVYRVADVPLEENIPIEGVRLGRRAIRWDPHAPATLVWTEALDEGDPKNKVPFREQLKRLAAPFQSPPELLVKVEHRFSGGTFFSDPGLMMTTEYDRDRRWIRSLLYQANQYDAPPRTIIDRNQRDAYGDPGRMITKPNENGAPVVIQDGDWVYMAGAGASPEGNLPFLDRKNLVTLETERLWRCAPGTLESVVTVIPGSSSHAPRFITRRESTTTPPNYFLKDLSDNSEIALTDFQDPTPQVRKISKQVVKYQRADGVPLSATLYLPADYKPGTKLPLLVWAYPLEFNDAATAGQVSATPSSFTRISGISHLSLLTQGYAIMDNATMPIIGDPETMNDTFIEQIVDAAQAAIDHAVELGVADRNRVAVGGHSYGAFMTANLLAHSDLFKAGIARSGAYNRTLTPFGFQSERRPIWDAKEVYEKVSPFMYADRIKAPILLIHGEDDNNSGTFPIQSQRMYQAVKGNGGNTRLVMLPYESHGYVARQSVLHTHAEMVLWLNKYVRDAEL